MSIQETALEKQYIGGQGTLIEFVKKSEKFGEYTLVDGDILDYLKKAAQCDDDEGRKLALVLIDKIERLNADSIELRKRFATCSTSLGKANDALKEENTKTEK